MVTDQAQCLPALALKPKLTQMKYKEMYAIGYSTMCGNEYMKGETSAPALYKEKSEAILEILDSKVLELTTHVDNHGEPEDLDDIEWEPEDFPVPIDVMEDGTWFMHLEDGTPFAAWDDQGQDREKISPEILKSLDWDEDDEEE